jgi:putative flavoprotein involved in K+ transport
MNGSIYEVIIIGAGHAGLSASYYLKHLGLEHIVFERGRIGETWRTQRWDNFKMITMNRMNVLPGHITKSKRPEQFSTSSEFVTSLREYATNFELPVLESSSVLSVEKRPGSPVFTVKVLHDNESQRTYDCWQVIVAAGMQNVKLYPSFAKKLASGIQQIHSSEYKNATQLVDGTVLVVGSGQSGCQIASDLLDAGRKVIISCTVQPYLPRSYRGKDIMDWLIMCKIMDEPIKTGDELSGKDPVIDTSDEEGNLSLMSLANGGAVLVGSVTDATSHSLSLAQNATEAMAAAENYLLSIKENIDEYIAVNQLQAASPGDAGDQSISPVITDVAELDLEEQGVRCIVWATGHTGDLAFIGLPVFDETGSIIQQSGVTPVDGLYVVGVPRQAAKKHAFIFGVKDDASFVTNKIYSILR